MDKDRLLRITPAHLQSIIQDEAADIILSNCGYGYVISILLFEHHALNFHGTFTTLLNSRG
jgi:hypothetical protein